MSEIASELTRRDTLWPRKVSMRLRTWPYPVHLALLVALYVGTAKFGLWLDAVGGFATAVWPPTGLALVALVRGGIRLWPGITLGAFLVNAWAGAPLLVAAGMALGNTLEALLSTLLLTRVVRFHPALDRLRDVVGLLGAAVVSTLVSATVGVTSAWLGGVIPAATAAEAWSTWWLGDMNGDLVVAALLFTWSTRAKMHLSSRPLLEGGGLLLAVVALSLLVFDRMIATSLIDFSYLLFPVLIWAALRFGPPGASAATAVVSGLAMWGTAHGRGPFVGPTFHESVLALQAFMSIVAATIVVLAAVVAERARAEQRLVTHEAITRLIAETTSPRAAIPRVFQTICESLEWDMGALWQVDREAPVLRYGESWQRPVGELADFAAASRQHTFASGVGLPGRVWASGEPAWIIDVNEDANFPRAPMARAAGLQSAFAFPLRLGTDLLGVMEFFSRKRRPPDEELLRMVTTIGGQLGQFLERMRAEQALREGEARLRLALQAGQMGTWEWDIATGQVRWSDTLEVIHGLAPGTFLGTYEAFLADMHPEDRPHVTDAIAKTLAKGSDHRLTYRIVPPDGRVRWVEGRGRLFADETGQPARMSGVCLDITTQMEAQDALRRAAALLDLTHESILVLDLSDTIIFWNRGAAEMYGWSSEEALGQIAYRLLQTRFPKPFEVVKAEILETGRWEGDLAQTRRDGSSLVVTSRWALQHDTHGEPLAVLEINSDITARTQMEAQLRASLQEKEVLLKEIHHRVKNNLQVISSLLSLQSATVQNPAVQDFVQESERRVQAMALVHETLYQGSDVAQLHLAEYVRTLSAHLVRAYGSDAERIALHTQVDAMVLSLDTAVPCGLILSELLSNCLKHAFPNGQAGEVTVTLAREADRMRLTVRDNGCGFPEQLDFRQTESLGLQLVCALTEQLQGTMALERIGGSAFTVIFPLPSGPEGRDPSAGAPPGGGISG